MTAPNSIGDYEILPPHLAIRSMRDSGYRDTAHAIAELVDNSIQAGRDVNECTEVELLCVDAVDIVTERRRQFISKIAVYDNASGMDADTLRMALQFGNGTHLQTETQDGIGKFGMGLPNASISQCRRVEVWSWQNSECVHTYLDVDEVLAGTLRSVPEPQASEIPDEWRKLVRDDIGEHGTLVVWSTIDRIRWKTSTAFLNNAELLVGRMYRYFLKGGKARIRLSSFEGSAGQTTNKIDRDVLPNDPLYVMTGTCAPPPFDETAAFDLFAEYDLEVSTNSDTHKVVLRFSISTKEARKRGGSDPIGKHANKNIGVSIVRASREIEMNNTFDIRYDPVERWWGVEVQFGPELDNIFGVTNNKQAATAFQQCDLDEDAKMEGLTPGKYREVLRESSDPRLVIYEVSQEITKTLRTMREQIKRLREGARSGGVAPPGSAEDIATKATKRRREQTGEESNSDQDEKLPKKEREKELAVELIAEGVDEKDANEIAVEYVKRNTKFLFQDAPVPGSAFFDIRSRGGTLIILINSRHPASDHLFDILKDQDDDTPALTALKLLLTAWARLEDVAGDPLRQQLEDIRSDWGRIARDFLQESEE